MIFLFLGASFSFHLPITAKIPFICIFNFFRNGNGNLTKTNLGQCLMCTDTPQNPKGNENILKIEIQKYRRLSESSAALECSVSFIFRCFKLAQSNWSTLAQLITNYKILNCLECCLHFQLVQFLISPK